ncbi:MAG: hypothetical protein TR69_WS6001000171 [candidate division WS6 bacterium OLB20]|uniref:Activator of Hsp90 ATPase homologue 1/2-like C-terminal domain-containing protein n=1 Tax=candidate division WS6 bacterium OLB20 TaxID=1617426 RepID=A0A136M093_9BACT|nr:MAG: hypothetical protein TR69_WS6001000171 [candidate division WS6 bacterium OLB20]
MDPITVQTVVKAPLDHVWKCWTTPEDINSWAFASADWEARESVNDVVTGGTFNTVMAAKDGSAAFDFSGVYTVVEEGSLIEYDLDDQRHVVVKFTETPEGVIVTQTFDPESENARDMQQEGWQAILNNFKSYAERTVR